jgi:hypothetical protein
VGELVESYSTVLSFLEMSSDQEWEKKTLIQNISKWTGEKRAREALQFPESNSIQNYTNAIACFENKKVLSLRKDQDKTWVQVLANSQELAKELSLLEGVLGNLR